MESSLPFAMGSNKNIAYSSLDVTGFFRKKQRGRNPPAPFGSLKASYAVRF
jgi:hypothetical protein